MFLKYLEEKKTGYVWDKTQGGELIIPGCALADDMLLMGSDWHRFRQAVSDFDAFLGIVGMSLNPSKSHFTSVGDTDAPPEGRSVVLKDEAGRDVTVWAKDSKLPIKYLGYYIMVHDWEGRLGKVWEHHNQQLMLKFKKVHAKIRRSRLRAGEVAHMTNSDAQSVLIYFMFCNWIPSGECKVDKSEGPLLFSEIAKN
jgi:hypothetical protein